MPRFKPNTIVGQFIPHRRVMLESPAWAALSLAARHVLDRLEIEHMHHGGGDNGNLPCTYGDFEKFGIRRKSISGAIAELVEGGFLQIVQRGRGGKYVSNPTASRYRLTYLATPKAAPTDDWQSKVPVAKMPPAPVANLPPGRTNASGENAPTAPVAKVPLLSISRVATGSARADDVAPPNQWGRVSGDGLAGGLVPIGDTLASSALLQRIKAGAAK